MASGVILRAFEKEDNELERIVLVVTDSGCKLNTTGKLFRHVKISCRKCIVLMRYHVCARWLG